MRDAIIHMFHNKEIAIVRLFEWLLPPQLSRLSIRDSLGAA